MTSATHVEGLVQNGRPELALTAAGALLAVAGGIWWAWDPDPRTRKALLLIGMVIIVVGFALARRPETLPPRAVLVTTVLVAIFAGYQLWAAITTIISQSAP
jgi:hypothetical protein